MHRNSKSFQDVLRRGAFAIIVVSCLGAWLVTIGYADPLDSGPPFMASGVKIGEVTGSRAIIWTRLTQTPDYKTDGVDFLPRAEKVELGRLGPEHGYGNQVPQGKTLEDMNTTVPGAPGEVRLAYWRADAPNERSRVGWTAVDDQRDFTKQFLLEDLRPGTSYRLRVEGRPLGSASPAVALDGEFATAPTADKPAKVSFTVVTGQMWNTRDDLKNGQKIYPQMATLQPNFFTHTGDIVYYDTLMPFVTHVDLARVKWNRTYALPFVRDFHQRVPSYFIKDDHDSWQNDDWPTMNNKKMGQFTWEQGKNVFLEQVPMGERTYRTIRWGKDLQIWLVEGRDFRSPNDAPDGPEKTIWGKQQIAWFKQTVTASDAAFRILISPTPIVGPDHLWKAAKSDNHVAARRAYEGNMLRGFLGKQKNMYVVCGDRHWQYVSEDPRSGVREYSCGPTTDKHATEISNEDRSIVKYIMAKGGFLSVTVERSDGVPTAIFRHHGVSGEVYNEDVRPATGIDLP